MVGGYRAGRGLDSGFEGCIFTSLLPRVSCFPRLSLIPFSQHRELVFVKQNWILHLIRQRLMFLGLMHYLR